MPLPAQVWQRDIERELFAGNPHVMLSRDMSQFAGFRTVNIPIEGTGGTVRKNPSQKPLPVEDRNDLVLEFDLDEFSVGPVVVEDLEQVEVTYDKRDSVTAQEKAQLADRLGRETAFGYAVSGDGQRIRRTSGSLEPVQPDGATGDRKALTGADLQKLREIMDLDLIPQNERYILMHPKMYTQFLDDPDVKNRNLNPGNMAAQGVVKQYAGFNIMVRPELPIYDSSAPPQKKALGSAVNSGDNLGCIAWHRNFVARARTPVKMYVNQDDPVYQGDVISGRVRHAASKLRKSNQGIYAIVQEA
jgi:hypothetical protein